MAKTKKKKNLSKKNAKPEIIKITPEQAENLLADILGSNLSDENSALVTLMIKGNRWLVEALERGQMTTNKLRKLLGIITSEKASVRKKKANSNSGEDDLIDSNEVDTTEGKSELKSKKEKGHGRNSANAYEGADIVDLKHETLNPGDKCPDDYCDGLLYEKSEPGVILRITGSPMAQATRFNLQKLRCADM